MEENKENVVVSEQQMEQINQEITKVEDSKIQEAKKEGAEEVAKNVLPTMEEIKKRQDELERKIAMKELEEKERTLKELETKPVRKAVVPESSNPLREAPKPEPVQQKDVRMSDVWDQMVAASKAGQFKASVTDVKR